jgi:hypothetical protein
MAWGFQRRRVALHRHLCCVKLPPPAASKLPTMLMEFHIVHNIKMLRSRVGNKPAVFHRLSLKHQRIVVLPATAWTVRATPNITFGADWDGEDRIAHWCRQKWSRAKLCVRSLRNCTVLSLLWVEDLCNDFLHERAVFEIGEASEIFHELDFRGTCS